MFVQFGSCGVHQEDGKNILKHTRKIGSLFPLFTYVNKIGFAASFAIKKSIQTRYFPNEKSFFYEFSPSEATIRKYTSKTLEHLYFGTSHYSLNAVGLLPKSFNSFNYEGFKLKRNKLAAAEHLGYEVFLLTLSKLWNVSRTIFQLLFL